MNHSEAFEALLYALCNMTEENPSLNSLYVKLMDDEDELLGTHTAPLELLRQLHEGQDIIDLFDEEAGGAVPTDIRGLAFIEVYRG